jgi:aryl-alcohol dehydrogenase-like predicted oxidoreductase
MQQRHLGSSGLTVSRLALGTMAWGTRTSPEEAEDIFTAYLQAGGNVVDTAYGYAAGRSEEILGRLLGTVGRDEVVVLGKAGIAGASNGSGATTSSDRVVDTSRRALMAQLDASLRRLGTDHLDVWMVHGWDEQTPITETVGVLEWAVTSGRTRYIGVANHSGWQAARVSSMLEALRIPLVAAETEYSLVWRRPELELADAAQGLGFGLLAWSPLGRGVLAGRYRDAVPADSRLASDDLSRFAAVHVGDHTRGVVDAVLTAARGLEVPPAVLALAWLRDRPGVCAPVIGPRTRTQLRALITVEDLELPREIAEVLDEVSTDHL